MTRSKYLEFHKEMGKEFYIIYFNRKLERG